MPIDDALLDGLSTTHLSVDLDATASRLSPSHWQHESTSASKDRSSVQPNCQSHVEGLKGGIGTEKGRVTL